MVKKQTNGTASEMQTKRSLHLETRNPIVVVIESTRGGRGLAIHVQAGFCHISC